MPGGRPPSGSKLVERLEGSPHAKRRVVAIIETLSGIATIEEACAAVGVRASEFHKLRERFLQEGLASLEPRPAGRPGKVVSEADLRAAALERELQNTRMQLHTARTREEFFAAMPRLAGRLAEKKGKGPRRDGDGTDAAVPARGDVAPGTEARRAADGDRKEALDDIPTA